MWSKLSSNGARLFTRSLYGFSTKPNRDLYDVLGVSKTSSQSDIKKAYYKLAQQYHPDKNKSAGAQDKFSEINNAYETLSDQAKRKMYDQTGSADPNFANQGFRPNPGAGFNPNAGFSQGFQGQTGQGFNPDAFNQFKSSFSGFNTSQKGGAAGFEDLFGDLFGANRASTSGGTQPETLMLAMEIAFSEAVNGVTKNIEYMREVVCSSCNGTRAKPGTETINCNTCNGTGFKSVKQGMMVMQTVCQSCHGEGKKIKQYCPSCKGVGAQQTKAYQSINIPRGIENNTNIKFKGKGNYGGDLIIKISVRPNPKFKRDGFNVHTQIEVPVVDMILGVTKAVQTIYGRKVNVTIPAGTQANKKIKVVGEGFYQPNSQIKGDFYVQIRPKIPTSLSQTQKYMYEQIRSVSKDY